MNDEASLTSSCCLAPSFSNVQYGHSNLSGDLPTVVKASQTIEKQMAQEMLELSIAERERIADELHGVSTMSKQEDPEFTANCLQLLENELQRIPNTARLAYNRAMALDSSYVTDRGFRIMFLRSEAFDVVKAAERMVRYFEYKEFLFGTEMLTKTIRYDDLSKDDQDSLHCGFLQILGTRDVMGRMVVFIFPELIRFQTWENHIRALWYQMMVAMEDETTQRNGIVFVKFGVLGSRFGVGYGKPSYIIKGLPIRIVAFHCCLIGGKMTNFFKYFITVYGKEIRTRIRIHVEDHIMSCLYVLQTFGIDPSSVPFGNDGRPQTDRLLQQIQYRKHYENTKNQDIVHTSTSRIGVTFTAQRSVAVTPTSMDVLIGRGQRYRSHTGNVALSTLIENETSAYEREPSYFGKTCIVVRIIQSIKESGGRFLRLDKTSGDWSIAEESVVHEVISSRFRNKRRWSKASSAL